MTFEAFFGAGADNRPPYPYQTRLAEQAWRETLVVPTGFGKTAAVLAAWLWKRAQRDADTPTRLVYCLPMRTLVEQTEAAALRWIEAARDQLGLEVQFDVLMGGRPTDRRGVPPWMRHPERPTILVGTQDMLVSAALMRGYGTSRYRWPVDFALLNNDALWVFDEVQLTGATLATSAQLEGLRRAQRTGRACRTLWMSATLDPAWLKTVDFTPDDAPRPPDLSDSDRAEAKTVWAAHKTLRPLDLSAHDVEKKDGLKTYAAAVAQDARQRTRPGTNTIVFLNTVARAQAVYDALAKPAEPPPSRRSKTQRDGLIDRLDAAANDDDLLLVHSRFRKAERDGLIRRLAAPPPPQGRIVVTTQALEAGVDVSSAVMLSEIAPWSSMVQRMGRANRFGEYGAAGAEVVWIDLPDAAAAPYGPEDFAASRRTLAGLETCGPAALAGLAPSPPPRGHVVRRRDLFDLFDTDPDLSGFDVDVSLYVRDADDTDVRLFWRPVAAHAPPPAEAPAPTRDELCPAPIGGAKALVKRVAGRAWRWDALAKAWSVVRPDDVFPGVVLWVDAACGGYAPERGFSATATVAVVPVEAVGPPEPAADDDREARTSMVSVSLAKHTHHVRREATTLAQALGLSAADSAALETAAQWHDLGKAHPAFVARTGGGLPPLAKWSTGKSPAKPTADDRKFFRHELASALAYLAHSGWAEDASLVAYLIAAHHGKVRLRLRALPKEPPPQDGRLFARGVWDGDLLPATRLGDTDVAATTLDLDLMRLGDGACGASWATRMQGVLKTEGPFRLAWLEALVRIADWRASDAEEKANHDDL